MKNTGKNGKKETKNVKYKVKSFRLGEDIYEEIVKISQESGLSYNILFKKFLELYNEEK